ncbi:chitinase [Boletus edulis]|nr:chitinase [Boletus edulis]
MSFAILSLTVLSMLRMVTSVALQTNCPGGIAAAWYAPDMLPLSWVSWDKYNTLIYSFAITTPSVNNITLSGSDPSLPQFVSEAHKNNVSAHIAIGGWGGSRFFSTNVATPENRTAFAQTVINFAEVYDLDGINFDWEYPNKQGIGCNIINANDTQNFLYFLQELRKDPVGARITLSAAVSITPFTNASGQPSTDVSGFAEVLDYITIMNYDIWGKWDSTIGVGPNAPLNDTCAVPANQQGSAVSAVEAWTAAGIPANQIVLGVASYGHSFSVAPHDAFVDDCKTELTAYPKFNASNQPPGDSQGNTPGLDVCGVLEGPGGTYTFKSLVEDGFLTTEGDPVEGISYRFDTCSQTPYVYNETSEVMISFDDVHSFAAKGSYIKETGLRGFAMWQLVDDSNNLLVDSIRNAVGYVARNAHKRNRMSTHW